MKNLLILFIFINVKSFCDAQDSLDDSSDDIDALLNSVDLQTDEGTGKEDHIVGGVEISIQLAPYQVQICNTYTKRAFCGGSIIHEEWILTAAHCLIKYRGAPDYLFIYTGSNLRNHGQRHEIEKMILHKDYDRYINLNDIALLKLKQPIVFDQNQNKIDFIDQPVQEGESLFISGFGHEEHRGEPSEELKGASVPISNQKSCAESYEKHSMKGHRLRIEEGMFCAGNGKNDSCQGDSGGPAVINHKLAGVVSFGNKCALENYPGIYTSVLKYQDWIEKKTKVPGIGQKSKDEILSRTDDENEIDVPVEKIDDPPQDNQQPRAPYHVQIRGSSNCEGAIIDEVWVLTAAQCLNGITNTNETDVLIGATTHGDGISLEVERKIVHKKYNPRNHKNDIALIKLRQPVVYSQKVSKVRIGKKLPQKGKLLLLGYKNNVNKDEAEKLTTLYTPEVGLKKCKNRKLCAQLQKTNNCLKGSGGPVTIDGELFGIVSHECANKPAVYTLVPEYRSWIESITHLKDL